MPIEMSSNTGGLPIEFDVVVERDDGDIFLAVVGDNQDAEQVLFDYFTTEPASIEYFFEMVTKAKEEWDRLIEEDAIASGEDEESELIAVIPVDQGTTGESNE